MLQCYRQSHIKNLLSQKILLRTDMKRNVKIIRNQNDQLLLFLSIPESQVYGGRELTYIFFQFHFTINFFFVCLFYFFIFLISIFFYKSVLFLSFFYLNYFHFFFLSLIFSFFFSFPFISFLKTISNENHVAES